jgi:cysteinyl-tRNA synthetase
MKTTTVLFASITCLLFACKDDGTVPKNVDFRQEMRTFVIGISQYAKEQKPGFLIIPQNGIELVSSDGEANGTPQTDYLNAIDGNGQEDLFYGYDTDDKATSAENTNYLKDFLNVSRQAGNTILVTDYCSTHSKMDASYSTNNQAGYVSFAASHRELDNIPNYPSPIYQSNAAVVTQISQVKNFLYLINPENYTSKASFIAAVTATNYDLLIMDLFFHEDSAFTASEIAQLKNKATGGKRLVISYMSIGEVENYRYYWQSDWNKNKPAWLSKENPDWPGNFKVWYWNTDWQRIIYGNDTSYLKKILDAGFDGVYLDIIDAFEYYENK